MARVKRGPKARTRRKRTLKAAEGFSGRRKNCYRIAAVAVDNAMKNAYIGRKRRKRDFRRLWTQRINAAARMCGVSYSQLIHLLKKAHIELDRKSLAELAVSDPKGFSKVVSAAKAAV